MMLSIAPAGAARNISVPTSAYRRLSAISTKPRSLSSPSAMAFRFLIAVDGVVRGKKVGCAWRLRAGSDARRRHLCRSVPDRSLCGRHDGFAKGWTALAAFMRACLKVLGTEIIHGEVNRETAVAA